MAIGYDPLLGELRSSNAKLILTQAPTATIEPILHLPLRDDARDISPYKHLLPNSQMVFTQDGWASGTLEFPLPKGNIADMTLAANVMFTGGGRGNMFGIDSEVNAFFWQHRFGTCTVLETWDSSYDHDFEQAMTGDPFHLVATLSGTTISVYVNGVLYGRQNWSHLDYPGATFYIWDHWGLVSDVRLYDTCLSEAEIWDVYQADRR